VHNQAVPGTKIHCERREGSSKIRATPA